MPDKPTLHVDPEALRASAKVLRGLPATIDAQRVKLYPLTLYPGEFSAGQELSEHTASTPAVMHFLEGDAHVTLGGDPIVASAGTWIHMQAQLPHSIRAKTHVAMLLLLMKQPQTA